MAERSTHLRLVHSAEIPEEQFEQRPPTSPIDPEQQKGKVIAQARSIIAKYRLPMESGPENGVHKERYWVPEQPYPNARGYVALCGIQEILPEHVDENSKRLPGYGPYSQYYELYVRDENHTDVWHYRFQPATDHPVQRWNGTELVDIDPVQDPEEWQYMEQAFQALVTGLET